MLELAVADIRKQGVEPLIVETYRRQVRQDYLYCQGRTIAEVTAKGINSFFAKAYCCPKAAKITWTQNSVHKSRKAVDIVPQQKVSGKITAIWNANDPKSQIIIKTMQRYGFEAGANWKTNPDSPHFQVTGSFSNVFDAKHTNPFVTKVIQKALGLEPNGKWGPVTTAAVKKFKVSMGHKILLNQITPETFKALLSR